MTALGYVVPHLADPDLWMKPEPLDANGDTYYSYILCFVDGILVIHHKADRILDRVGKFFMLKPESVEKPNVYLKAKLCEHQCPTSVRAWTMSPFKYVLEAVKNCHKHLKEHFDGTYSLPQDCPKYFSIIMNLNLTLRLPLTLKLPLTTCLSLAAY